MGFLIFSSLVLIIVSSSSTMHEAIATSLNRLTGVLFAPGFYPEWCDGLWLSVCLRPHWFFLSAFSFPLQFCRVSLSWWATDLV
jgi:hypothetical protein